MDHLNHLPPAEHTRPAPAIRGSSRPRAAGPQILAPVRWDDEDAYEIPHVLAVAARTLPGATVTLLSVLDPAPETGDRSLHWLDAIDKLNHALVERSRTAAERLNHRRDEMAAWIRDDLPAHGGVACELRADCRIGDPAEEIARYAEEQAVDLVVLGRRQAGWRWPLRQSVTSRVLARTGPPVLIVRPDRLAAAR